MLCNANFRCKFMSIYLMCRVTKIAQPVLNSHIQHWETPGEATPALLTAARTGWRMPKAGLKRTGAPARPSPSPPRPRRLSNSRKQRDLSGCDGAPWSLVFLRRTLSSF